MNRDNLMDLVTRTRTFRRFAQSKPVTEDELRQLVEITRLTSSASNKQALKYILSCTPEQNEKIFPALAWAKQLKDWQGPEPSERPTGYIVILEDLSLSGPLTQIDYGIAAYTLMLGATTLGLGGCILYSVNRPYLVKTLNIPDQYKVALVFALGQPAETVVLEPMQNGETAYWRDENQVHHVPKRSLDELIVRF